jgi:hypothetical protein
VAGVSVSDDSTDIFWPGYVDAVTNLAINLLFVIAVMAIVVISATLQISKMKPAADGSQVAIKITENMATDALSKTTEVDRTHVVAPVDSLSSNRPGVGDQPSVSSTSKSHEMREVELYERIELLQQKIRQLEGQQLDRVPAVARQQKDSLVPPKAQIVTGGSSAKAVEAKSKPSVLYAQERPQSNPLGLNEFEDSGSGGVIVVFAPDVIELSDAEGVDFLRKLNLISAVKDSRWELRVVSPKGFSEASRLAFYRLHMLRNILIKQGVSPQNVEMRVIEVDTTNANNARVLVRPVP